MGSPESLSWHSAVAAHVLGAEPNAAPPKTTKAAPPSSAAAAASAAPATSLVAAPPAAPSGGRKFKIGASPKQTVRPDNTGLGGGLTPAPVPEPSILRQTLDKASNNLEGRPTIPEVTEVEVTGEGEKMPVDIPPVAPDQMVAMLKALEDAPDLAAGCIAALPLVRVLPSNAADEPRIRVAFDSFIDDTNKFKSPTPAQGVVFLRGVSDTKVQTVQNAILPSITAPASLQPLIDVRKGTDTKALKRIQPLIDKGISQLLGKDSTVPGILKRFKDDPDDPKLILELKKLYEATTLSKDDKLTHALAILLGHVVFKGKILEKDADGDSGYARYLKYLNDNNLPKPNIPDAPYVNYLFKPQSPAQILQQNFSSAATLQQAEKFLK